MRQLIKDLIKKMANASLKKKEIELFCKELEAKNNSTDFRDMDIEYLIKTLNRFPANPTPNEYRNFQIPLRRFLQKENELEPAILKNDKIVKKATLPIHLGLENIRSTFNTGLICRNAEALGVQKINFIGYTAGPENSKFLKTSMGTHEWIELEKFDNSKELINSYRNKGFLIVALETMEESVELSTFRPDKPVLIIAGNEKFGLEPETLGLCDIFLSIEMLGKKNSLNVAQSVGITCYHFSRIWQKTPPQLP